MKVWQAVVLVAGLGLGIQSAHAGGFAQCRAHFAEGEAPRMAQISEWQARELCFDAFAVLHSGKTKTPLYVVEKLNRARLLDARDEERSDHFYADARLPPSERAELDDYRGEHCVMSFFGRCRETARFDRGHLAPAADQPNARAMAQSFSLANIVPQAPVLNRKAWSKIEQDTRKYALRAGGDVFVITGVVYEGKPLTIGERGVWVPSYLYKLVYDPATNRAWAHWVENRDDAHIGRPVSYAQLVERTGIDFFPGIVPRR
jgi:endonuclease G, mitochondrial